MQGHPIHLYKNSSLVRLKSHIKLVPRITAADGERLPISVPRNHHLIYTLRNRVSHIPPGKIRPQISPFSIFLVDYYSHGHEE